MVLGGGGRRVEVEAESIWREKSIIFEVKGIANYKAYQYPYLRYHFYMQKQLPLPKKNNAQLRKTPAYKNQTLDDCLHCVFRQQVLSTAVVGVFLDLVCLLSLDFLYRSVVKGNKKRAAEFKQEIKQNYITYPPIPLLQRRTLTTPLKQHEESLDHPSRPPARHTTSHLPLLSPSPFYYPTLRLSFWSNRRISHSKSYTTQTPIKILYSHGSHRRTIRTNQIR